MTLGKLLTCVKCGETAGVPVVSECGDGKPRCANPTACARRRRAAREAAKVEAVERKRTAMEHT